MSQLADSDEFRPENRYLEKITPNREEPSDVGVVPADLR